MPIHVMLQPDYLTARVAALEDLEIYVEDLTFTKLLCSETMAVKRERPMQVCSLACAGSGNPMWESDVGISNVVGHSAHYDIAPSRDLQDADISSPRGICQPKTHPIVIDLVVINAHTSVPSAAPGSRLAVCHSSACGSKGRQSIAGAHHGGSEAGGARCGQQGGRAGAHRVHRGLQQPAAQGLGR